MCSVFGPFTVTAKRAGTHRSLDAQREREMIRLLSKKKYNLLTKSSAKVDRTVIMLCTQYLKYLNILSTFHISLIKIYKADFN